MRGRATAARRAALEIFRRVRGGDLLDRAFTSVAGDLPRRDRAWTQELVYGTMRLRGRLDHLLDALVHGGIEALDPEVLDVLRLGAYQLREMGSVPPYAAISQSQELIRTAGLGRAAKLVGGVLHALEREGDRIPFPSPADDPVEYLTTWGSHPRWLIRRWLDRWNFDQVRMLVELNNQRPELYLRPIGQGREAALEQLAAAGVEAEAFAGTPDGIRLHSSADVAAALAAVPAVVQDPAAALVVRYAAVPPGSRVLDLCAAPGGKGLGLAEAAAYVVASDISPARLRLVQENSQRVGREAQVGLVAADARTPPFRPADVVLLDVPCTGTGTFRRHPDGRWRVTEVDLMALAELQRELLESAAAVVRPGGFLVYSTCSLEPEENEVQVQNFLDRNPDFSPDPPSGVVAAELRDERGWLRVLPQQTGVDGAFAARLRRAA